MHRMFENKSKMHEKFGKLKPGSTVIQYYLLI